MYCTDCMMYLNLYVLILIVALLVTLEIYCMSDVPVEAGFVLKTCWRCLYEIFPMTSLGYSYQPLAWHVTAIVVNNTYTVYIKNVSFYYHLVWFI